MGDRDGYTRGVPILGQLAGALADAGFLAVRYDKRGYGQSGGRAESATLTDFAEDARGVVRWLANRKDIDPRRIAVVGHSEGAWVALLAAASKDRRIAAVVTIAAPSTTGAEVVLEQQQLALDPAERTPDDRAAKVALQKKIHGGGAVGHRLGRRARRAAPPGRHAVVPEPARLRPGAGDRRTCASRCCCVHGQLDRQVPVEHVERLTTLARTDSKSKSVEVVTVRGVNHLLVPAITGEVGEYSTLEDRNVSARRDHGDHRLADEDAAVAPVRPTPWIPFQRRSGRGITQVAHHRLHREEAPRREDRDAHRLRRHDGAAARRRPASTPCSWATRSAR